MRNVPLFLCIFALTIHVRGQGLDDIVLLGEIKHETDSTDRRILQEMLDLHIKVYQALIDDSSADRETRNTIQWHANHAKYKLADNSVTHSDMTNFMIELSRIISRAPTAADTDLIRDRFQSAADLLLPNHIEKVNRHIQLFTYKINPKIRQLSEETQLNEPKLLTAFNSVAYAGLVKPDELFRNFKSVLDAYLDKLNEKRLRNTNSALA